MKIIKRIARKILAKELAKRDSILLSVTSHYVILSEKYADEERDFAQLSFRTADLERRNVDLNNTLWNKKKFVVSKGIFQAVMLALPDANGFGSGKLEITKLHNVMFRDRIGNQYHEHKITLTVPATIDNSVTTKRIGVYIGDYEIYFEVPCVMRNINYNMFGFNSTVSSYIWDINATGIQVMSDEAWEMISSFVVAQKNVLSEII